MDNVTHSLFGYALARACMRARPPEPENAPLERALIFSSVFASNAPDLDIVTGFFGSAPRLTYLLEHRGYTHTLLFGVAIGVLSGLGCARLARLRAARDRLAVCAVGALACLLHVGFDFLNDYGVHPFFPFDDRWYYGDSLFIIEPLLIVVLLPLPAAFGRSFAGRALAGALGFGLLSIVWFTLPWSRALAVTLALLFASWAQLRVGPTALPALGAAVLVVGLFAVGAKLAEAQLRTALEVRFASERVLDIATVPAPADPSCHRALAITLDPAGTYRARVARSQLFGSASSCRMLPARPTAPLVAAAVSGDGPVQFDASFSAPAAALSALARERCDAAALLRFIRIPYWMRREDGVVLGDLRYDRAPALEFAERVLTGTCAGIAEPRWVPPRRDLIGY